MLFLQTTEVYPTFPFADHGRWSRKSRAFGTTPRNRTRRPMKVSMMTAERSGDSLNALSLVDKVILHPVKPEKNEE